MEPSALFLRGAGRRVAAFEVGSVRARHLVACDSECARTCGPLRWETGAMAMTAVGSDGFEPPAIAEVAVQSGVGRYPVKGAAGPVA